MGAMLFALDEHAFLLNGASDGGPAPMRLGPPYMTSMSVDPLGSANDDRILDGARFRLS